VWLIIFEAIRVHRSSLGRSQGVNGYDRAAVPAFNLTARASEALREATSVVDADCRSHNLPDLLVIDGGVFVTVGGVNPTSTIQASALRAADALATRLEAST